MSKESVMTVAAAGKRMSGKRVPASTKAGQVGASPSSRTPKRDANSRKIVIKGVGLKHRGDQRLFDFVDVYRAAPMERIAMIRGGVGASQVIDFAVRLDTSKEQLMKTLGLPRATVDRKAKKHEDLSIEQAERLVGLSSLIGQVQTIVEQSGDPSGFDAAHWVGHWLGRPNPALNGMRPAELMDTVAGQEVVSSVLAMMQSGAYA